jgi:hypothetical protein
MKQKGVNEFSHKSLGLSGSEPITKTVRLTCLCDRCKESFELVLTKKQVEMLWKAFKTGAKEATGFMDKSLEKTYGRFGVKKA